MSKKRKNRSGKSGLFRTFVDVPLFLLGVLTVTSFLAGMWWVFELTCHFRFQYALGLAAIGVFTYMYNLLPRSVLAWALFLCHAPLIAPFYMPVSPFTDVRETETTERIDCAAVNVSEDNRDLGDVRNWVRQQEPDLLILMEVDLDWVNEATELNRMFDYRKTLSRAEQYGRSGDGEGYEFAGQYGMVLFSNQPVHDTRILRPPETTVSVLYADVEVGDQIVNVTGVHTPSPTGAHLARARNRVLSGVADRVAGQTGPRIVLGDLNTTSYSPYFWSFLNQTGLKDTRKGWGLQPTWPTFMGTGLFQICLDHCLVSKEFRVVERGVGPDVGSDHYPITATLELNTGTDD